jgi:hypothetical protein
MTEAERISHLENEVSALKREVNPSQSIVKDPQTRSVTSPRG